MGCFNVACSVSSLSIGCGDRVAYIPLMKDKYADSIEGSSSLIYSNCIFNPLCLPIIGEYNDYGCIENIEDTPNSRAVAKFFGTKDIEKLSNILFESKPKGFENMSGMFIHGDIYDTMVSGHTRADVGPTAKILKDMGFLPKNGDGEGKDYYHPEVEDNEAFVESSKYGSAKIKDSTKQYSDYINDVYALVLDYQENHGVTLDIGTLDQESCFSENFIKISESVKSHELKKSMTDKQKIKIKEGFDKMKDPSSDDYEIYMRLVYNTDPLRDSTNHDMYQFRNWDHFRDIYKESIADGSIEKEYTDWQGAASSMYSSNVFFFPAMNGEQHGNDEQSKKLYESALAVINKRIKIQNEENY